MNSLILDIRTLAIILIAVSVLLSLIMLLLWRTRKTYPGFGLWTASSAMYAMGFFLLILRGRLPDFLTVLLANLCLLAAAVFIFEGIRCFRGAVGRWSFSIVLLVTLVLLLAYFNYVHNSLDTRIFVFSMLSAGVYSGCAAELLRDVPLELRLTSRITSGLFALYSLILLGRAFLAQLGPGQDDLFVSNGLQSFFFISSLLFGLAWMFSFVSLNSERLEMELKNAQVELQRMAHTDYLTGVSNSRRFFETGEIEYRRAKRLRHPLGVLMLDIDNFKNINDVYGHASGDKVLAAVSSLCCRTLRIVDTFGRLGGDEFAALLPETDQSGTVIAAERLRAAIAETEIEVVNSRIRVSVSLGASVLLPHDDQIEQALNRADKALYDAKRNGRNQFCTAFDAQPS